MRYRKASKWKRYLNILLGINSKPAPRTNSIEPGSRCVEVTPEDLQFFSRENTIYHSGVSDGQPQMC
jgi:hypothetical protein